MISTLTACSRSIAPVGPATWVLFHFEDLSYEQIAVQLRVTLAKVKTDIRRARAALLPLLRSGGIARDVLQD